MVRAGLAAFVTVYMAAMPLAASAQTLDELYASGVKARQSGHFNDAVDLLHRALALKPDNADALVQLGFAELGRGDLAPARDAFSKALALAPAYADARFGLAQIEFRSGNLDKAFELAGQMSANQPENKDVAVLLANIQKARAARVEAGHASKANRKRPRSPQPDALATLMHEGRSLRAAGRFPEAEDAYRRALRIAPRDTDVLVALGHTLGSQQKFEEARQSFDRALEIRSGMPDAELANVRLALWQGDVERARMLVDAVLPSVPGNAEAMALDGRIALLEGDDARAKQAFEQALAADQKNAEALTGLGDVQRAHGDEGAARQAYSAALALQPGSKDIEDRLAQPPPRKWRFDIGSEVSGLTGGRGTWTDSAMGLAYRATPSATLSARLRMATRYGQTDTQIEGRIDKAFFPSFSAYALAAGTPDADFLARYSLGGGASWEALPLQDGLGPLLLNIDARYDSFANSSVTTVSPWVQTYVFDGRLGLSARWVHAFDDDDTRADGYVLRADFVITPRLNAFIGYGDAPEIDDGSLVPTRTVFGGASWDVSGDITLRMNLAHEERPSFDRNTIGFGLTKRF